MAKFCNKCGKPLINGQTCNCQNKKINIIKVIPVVFTLMLMAAAVTIYIFNKNNRNDENNSVYSSETETVTAEETTENTESTNKEKNYFWYLKPAVEADELYTYDFEAVDYADYMGEKNDVYDWFAVIKKDGFYNIVDYNGKQYLTEKYTDYFEHACVGIMLDKAEGEEVTDDYTRDYNADSEYNNEWADKNLTIWYNSDIKKTEFVKGGSSAQGHGGDLGEIFMIEDDKIVKYGTYPDGGTDDSPSYEYNDKLSIEEYNKNNALVINDKDNKGFGIAFNNKLIVPCEYKQYYEDDYFIWLGTDDDKWYLYNKNGVKIFDFPCKSISANNYLVSDHFGNHYDGGVYMENGGRVPYLCTENKVGVYNDNGCAYFKTNGTQITDYGEFEEIRPVHNNLAWVKKDGKWGVIQFNGRNTYVTPEIAEKSSIVTEAEIKNAENKEIPKTDGWKSAYKNIINGLSSSDDMCYNIYDMDNDGVPELFISNGKYHMAGVLIYTYYNNEAVKLGEYAYGSYGTVEIFKDSGQLVSADSSQGYTSCVVYKKVGNKLESVFSCWNDAAAVESNPTYKVNDKEVSVNEYVNSYNSYFKNKKMLVLGAYYGYSLNDTSLIDSYTTNENSLNLQGESYTCEELQIDVDYNADNNNNNSSENNNNNDNNASAEYATGYVNTDDGDELFVRSSPEIIDSPGKGNKFDCFPNGTALNINLSKSVDDWYYVTGIGLSGNTATGYVSKQFVVVN